MTLEGHDGAGIEFDERVELGEGSIGCARLGRVADLRDEGVDDEEAVGLVGEGAEGGGLNLRTRQSNASIVGAHQHVGETKNIFEQTNKRTHRHTHECRKREQMVRVCAACINLRVAAKTDFASTSECFSTARSTRSSEITPLHNIKQDNVRTASVQPDCLRF